MPYDNDLVIACIKRGQLFFYQHCFDGEPCLVQSRRFSSAHVFTVRQEADLVLRHLLFLLPSISSTVYILTTVREAKASFRYPSALLAFGTIPHGI